MLTVVAFLVTAAAIPGCAHMGPPLGLKMPSDWDFVNGDQLYCRQRAAPVEEVTAWRDGDPMIWLWPSLRDQWKVLITVTLSAWYDFIV
jgi:hypothetical protein